MSQARGQTEDLGVKPRLTAAARLASAIFATGAVVLLLGGNGRAAVTHTCSADAQPGLMKRGCDVTPLL
jgi:hypothetical protein